MAVDLSLAGLYDIREPILGDSFNWAGVEPTAAKKSFVIHSTGVDGDNQDGFTMAEYHVNTNGWGGIGVHFVVTSDGYPGRAGVTPPGAQIQYVGDLGTWRAGCLNQNPGRIHLEIVGDHRDKVPTASQLRLVRELIDYLRAPNMILPSFNYFSQVTWHNAVPGQNTECPGWANPNFHAWFDYLQGGNFPDALFAAPAPAPTPVPTVVPTPTPEPGKGGGEPPEWESSYRVSRETKTIQREGAEAVDVTTGLVVASVPVGTEVQIAGYFQVGLTRYARSVWSADNNKWNGIADHNFDPPTGQPSGVIPVTVSEPTPTEQLHQFLDLPPLPKFNFFAWLWEPFAKFFALILKKRSK